MMSRREYYKRYRETHAEEIRERKKSWKCRNPEKRAAQKRRYAARNREKYREAGDRLQEYRLRLGLLQREVAALAGVTQGTITRWETGAGPYDPERIRRIPGFEDFGA